MCALPAQSRVSTSLMEGGAVEAFANLHAQLYACEGGGWWCGGARKQGARGGWGQARCGRKVQEGRRLKERAV